MQKKLTEQPLHKSNVHSLGRIEITDNFAKPNGFLGIRLRHGLQHIEWISDEGSDTSCDGSGQELQIKRGCGEQWGEVRVRKARHDAD